jgi:modulator of FtsH protease
MGMLCFLQESFLKQDWSSPMNRPLEQVYDISSTSLLTRNRVLRNTYWLLALSMVPTILGAWLGVQLKLTFFSGSPLLGFMAFMAIAFGFFYAIEKTKDSGLGVAVLLGFTFFMGLMLSRLIGHILGFSNGAALIMTACGGTGTILAVMATIATVSKRDFSGLGKWLFAGVLVILVAAVANIFLQLPALYLTVSIIAIAIFSAYILFDVQQIINGGETNYISATLNIYLDIYNIFSNLLALLGIFGGSRD